MTDNEAAAAATQEELVELLVDGARYGDMEDVNAALQAGVDVNAKDEGSRTALHMASANGHLTVVEALLSARAEPDCVNSEGNTPLHWACLNGHPEIVKRLLQAGANPSKLNSSNETPVDNALNRDFEAVMEVIREATAHQLGDENVDLPDGTEGEDGPPPQQEQQEQHQRGQDENDDTAAAE